MNRIRLEKLCNDLPVFFPILVLVFSGLSLAVLRAQELNPPRNLPQLKQVQSLEKDGVTVSMEISEGVLGFIVNQGGSPFRVDVKEVCLVGDKLLDFWSDGDDRLLFFLEKGDETAPMIGAMYTHRILELLPVGRERDWRVHREFRIILQRPEQFKLARNPEFIAADQAQVIRTEGSIEFRTDFFFTEGTDPQVVGDRFHEEIFQHSRYLKHDGRYGRSIQVGDSKVVWSEHVKLAAHGVELNDLISRVVRSDHVAEWSRPKIKEFVLKIRTVDGELGEAIAVRFAGMGIAMFTEDLRLVDPNVS